MSATQSIKKESAIISQGGQQNPEMGVPPTAYSPTDVVLSALQLATEALKATNDSVVALTESVKGLIAANNKSTPTPQPSPKKPALWKAVVLTGGLSAAIWGMRVAQKWASDCSGQGKTSWGCHEGIDVLQIVSSVGVLIAGACVVVKRAW